MVSHPRKYPHEVAHDHLLFPGTQRCDKVKGFEHVGRNKSQTVDKGKRLPLVVDEGEMVYWRIPQPRLGASYKLEWEWQYTAVTSQAVIA